MSAWTHPSLGPIELIPPKLCPKKVWQHFYDPHEHWERVCAVDVAAMRREAEAIVGAARATARELPRLAGERWRRSRDLLVAHHAGTYAPAYASEMSSTETAWTSSMDAAQRHHALTPRSVFIVVQLDEPRSWVITAFRPHPPVRGVEWDEAELRRHGVWYFRKETGVNVDDFAPVVAENLRRVSAPATTKELWWLASAVGFGRLLRHVSEVHDALVGAEAALSETPESLLAELRRALNWTALEERLADALKDARPEDLEGVLAEAEELLAVGAVVGAEPEAEAFCDEAEMLLPWLPVEWAHVADRARHRLRATAAQPSLVARLWSAVEDAATAAIAREAAPAVRPASRLVDALIPQSPRWFIWQERIAGLPERAIAAAAAWIDQSIAALTIAPLAPTMGGSGVANDEWAVRGRPAPGAPHYRVFVVDEEHPDGWEVTERFTEADGELWRLDANEPALVVIIAGERPLVGLGMAQVLTEASSRDDVVARARELQPTHATKARR
jgi:hypothetical protein